MKILKRTVALTLSFSLAAAPSFAAELSVSYGQNDRLSLKGTGFESSSLSVTAAPSTDVAYTADTPFAVLKELTADSGGGFAYSAKMPASAASGWYDATVYDAVLGEVKETFFYCSPYKAASALSALGGAVSLSDLTANSAALGISADLADGTDTGKLITYFNQFKPGGVPTAQQFASAYLGALLCGAKEYSFDQFADIITNNSYVLGCTDHPLFGYTADKQKQIFEKLTSLSISSSSFANALLEAAFLISVNEAETQDAFKKVIFTEFGTFLSLNTSGYDALTSPENVITALMQKTYSSADEFKASFTLAVTAQTKVENEKKEDNSSGGGKTSSKGTFSGGTSSQPSVITPTVDTPAPEPAVFDDVADHWAKDAIMYLKGKSVVDGIGSNLYDPERTVTRCEFAKMIAGAFYTDAQAPQGNFADVTADDWFAPFVYALSSRGIINGVGDGSFAPHATITRQDAAVIINRAAAFGGISLGEQRTSAGFADEADIAAYAKEAVDTLYKAQLINGMSDTLFDPHSGVTRAQAAQMIYNLLTKQGGAA